MPQQEPLFPDVPVAEDRKLRASGRRQPQSCFLVAHGETTWVFRKLQEIMERMEALELVLDEVARVTLGNMPDKESYSTKEIARILDKKPYTIREWCRLGRINAFKADCGRGSEIEWRVSHEELVRIQNKGLLPIPDRY